MEYEDILYEVTDGVATITINRPKVMNAFRGQTCDELIHAFNRAGWTARSASSCWPAPASKAFCTGGDQSRARRPVRRPRHDRPAGRGAARRSSATCRSR